MSFLLLFAARSKRVNLNFSEVQYMDIAGIKKIIKDNPRVILYFGADWEQFVNVNKATGGFIPAHPERCTELCLLYANGKYDGFNREDSIRFFKMDFHSKKAYYARWTFAGREDDDEWLLVDLSHDRKARVI